MWLDEEAKMGLISSVYYKFFVLRGSTMSDIISTLLGGEQSWTSTFNRYNRIALILTHLFEQLAYAADRTE